MVFRVQVVDWKHILLQLSKLSFLVVYELLWFPFIASCRVKFWVRIRLVNFTLG